MLKLIVLVAFAGFINAAPAPNKNPMEGRSILF